MKRWRIGAAVAGLGTAVALVVAPSAAATSRPTTGLVTVTVNPHGHGQGPLPSAFIGLSYESYDLNSGLFTDAGNLPALLRNFGPGVLRFGGNSVDQGYAGISSGAVRALATLARKTGWKVLYSENLDRFSASRVRADARRVTDGLGKRLLAIACGNEPEDFAGRVRPSDYTESDYLATDVPRCRRAVASGAPRAPFAGPDTFRLSGGPGDWSIPWLTSYARAARAGQVRALSLLTQHFYAMSNCGGHSGGLATLISKPIEAKERGDLDVVRHAAATAGVPYAIDESNSASCGGIPRVSDAYVSALWAADWLLLAAEARAKGVYFQGGLDRNCAGYTPLCEVGNHRYEATPVYYGMLFAHLMGTGEAFATPLTISGTTSAHVVTHAVVNSAGRIRVMVENLGSSPIEVLLKAPGAVGEASTWSLTGPSLGARSGERIQGTAVRADGTFRPHAPSHVTCQAGRCRLTLPAHSAKIVLLPR